MSCWELTKEEKWRRRCDVLQILLMLFALSEVGVGNCYKPICRMAHLQSAEGNCFCLVISIFTR